MPARHPFPARPANKAAAARTRRTACVLLGLLALPCAAVPAEIRTAPAALPARSLRNGWGVCGQPGIDADAARFAAMLDQVGTRLVRSPVAGGGVAAASRFAALGRAMRDAGMASPVPRVTALVTAYLNDPANTWAAQQRALAALAAAGMLDAVEGPNELNNRQTGNGAHGPDDLADRTAMTEVPANFLAWARTLHGLRHAPGMPAGLVLVAPSIASGLPAEYRVLPDVSALADAGNLHFYAGNGRQPSFSLPPNPGIGSFNSVLGWARAVQRPGGPMWLTETGASTSGNYARDGASQAKYLANQLFDAFAAGVSRVFIYQLVDGSSAPGDVEGNFGLFRHDGTAKPAAAMLGRLQRLLSLDSVGDPRDLADDRPLVPGFDPAPMVATGQAAFNLLVLAKSDRSSLVVVWDEPPIDDGKGGELVPPPNAVRLQFGSVQRFRVHDLLLPAPPSPDRFGAAAEATVLLRGYPMLVELAPPS